MLQSIGSQSQTRQGLNYQRGADWLLRVGAESSPGARAPRLFPPHPGFRDPRTSAPPPRRLRRVAAPLLVASAEPLEGVLMASGAQSGDQLLAVPPDPRCSERNGFELLGRQRLRGGAGGAPVRVEVPPPGGHCNPAGGRSRRCAVLRAGTGDPAPRLRSVPQTAACAAAAQGVVVVDGVARRRGAGDAERERAWSLGVHGPWGSPRVLGSSGRCSCPSSSPSRGTNVRSPCFLLYGADASSRRFGAEPQTQMEQDSGSWVHLLIAMTNPDCVLKSRDIRYECFSWTLVVTTNMTTFSSPPCGLAQQSNNQVLANGI